MNGTKVCFDTNTLINFLSGYRSLQEYSNYSVCLSIISIIEFLAFPSITQDEETLLFSFLNKVEVIDLGLHNAGLLQQITHLRKSYKIKLPDAIIAGTAISKGIALVTNDKDFDKINLLQTLNY